MRRGRHRRARAVAAAAGVALLCACSAIRFGPGDPGVDLTGEYVGHVDVEGHRVGVRLQLAQDGDELDVVLRAPTLALKSRGEGDVDRDGTLSFDLGYHLECPGSAGFRGRWLEEGLRLTGSVAAADCTGSFEGRFVFRRR